MIANFNSFSCGELFLFLKYTGSGEGVKIIEKTLDVKILSRQFQHLWPSFQSSKDEEKTCLMATTFSRPTDYLSFFVLFNSILF